jgi:hypothetical protein
MLWFDSNYTQPPCSPPNAPGDGFAALASAEKRPARIQNVSLISSAALSRLIGDFIVRPSPS